MKIVVAILVAGALIAGALVYQGVSAQARYDEQQAIERCVDRGFPLTEFSGFPEGLVRETCRDNPDSYRTGG